MTHGPVLARRAILTAAAVASSYPPSAAVASPYNPTLPPPPLSPRLDAAQLAPLSDLGVPSRPGVLRYPDWLLGSWRVRNRIAGFSMPLGSYFVDPFTRATATDDVRRAEELSYVLRWVAEPAPADEPRLVAVQDREFNGIEETAAFLGPDGGRVSAARFVVDDAAPHGRLLLAVADPPEEAAAGGGGAATTIELVVEWTQWEAEASQGAFVTSELLRQRVRRPGAFGEPPMDETSLVESVTRYERPASADAGEVFARNRIAQYGLAVAAGGAVSRRDAARGRLAEGRATSITDYDWRLERVRDGARTRSAPRRVGRSELGRILL